MLSEVHLLKSELDALLGENRDAYWAFFKKVREWLFPGVFLLAHDL